MSKDIIRHQMKALRDRLPQKEQEDLSRKVFHKLLETNAYQECEMIFLFMSFGSEIDTRQIIHQALLDGKNVYLPRVNKDKMDFYEIRNMDCLVLSKYGILEPLEEESLRYKEEPEVCSDKQRMNQTYTKLMLMPGLAFDVCGNRIGYGAGYYDKYLNTHNESLFYKIALAFDFQVVDQIHADEFDIKADAILTPTSLIQK